MLTGRACVGAVVLFLIGIGLTSLYSARLIVTVTGGSSSGGALTPKTLNDYFILKAQAGLSLLRASGGAGLSYYFRFNEKYSLYSAQFKGLIYMGLLRGISVAAIYNR